MQFMLLTCLGTRKKLSRFKFAKRRCYAVVPQQDAHDRNGRRRPATATQPTKSYSHSRSYKTISRRVQTASWYTGTTADRPRSSYLPHKGELPTQGPHKALASSGHRANYVPEPAAHPGGKELLGDGTGGQLHHLDNQEGPAPDRDSKEASNLLHRPLRNNCSRNIIENFIYRKAESPPSASIDVYATVPDQGLPPTAQDQQDRGRIVKTTKRIANATEARRRPRSPDRPSLDSRPPKFQVEILVQFFFTLASFSRFSSKYIHNNDFNFVQNFAKLRVQFATTINIIQQKSSSSSKLLRPLVPPVRKRPKPSLRGPEKFLGQPVKYDTWDASIREKLAIEDPPSEVLQLSSMTSFSTSQVSLGYSSSITRVRA